MKIDFAGIMTTVSKAGKTVGQLSVPAVVVGAGTVATAIGGKLAEKKADEFVNGETKKEEPKTKKK